ncbi:MAG: hypothetical protein KatS3mg110_2385 [Pirellulaceae bacterium]|nr:MAG: hypothetical protein KatS3mg110_1926 [Pirellulaceae bacterium]GIW94344.1 MAG: hypothetical protein KatS3mg110_2385 [Pirellulaceae bacterium]
MRVRARSPYEVERQVAAEDRMYVGNPFEMGTTPGREYEVHALFKRGRFVELFYIDDNGYASFGAANHFELVDGSIPPDWICNIIHEGDEHVLAVGPPELIKDWETIENYMDGDVGFGRDKLYERLERLKRLREENGMT